VGHRRVQSPMGRGTVIIGDVAFCQITCFYYIYMYTVREIYSLVLISVTVILQETMCEVECMGEVCYDGYWLTRDGYGHRLLHADSSNGTGSHFVTQRPSDPGIQRRGDAVDPVTMFYNEL